MSRLKFVEYVSWVLVVVLSVLSDRSHAIRLSPNGGYDIVIGVEPSTREPINDPDFMNEIRTGMEAFSEELWRATNKRFYINSVEVLIPGNWWTFHLNYDATWQTLENSEFRMSGDVAAPNVINPNACGTSGQYVELPDTFFRQGIVGDYGPIAKSLVNLWARYRFGVWEEHGTPGDTQFPYFYAQPSFEPKWQATGCNNEEVTGDFLTIEGEVSDRCDPLAVRGPADDCRFIPSDSNTANSSLQHFHWMDSVTEFCDSKTHNHAAPNRQNLFCSHRSVWEVIRTCDDYTSTTSCSETPPTPTFRYLKDSRSPQLYILLDRGRTVTPEKVLMEALGAIETFIVTTPSIERINVAVGTYPHENKGKDHYYVREEISWGQITDVKYEIQRVLLESVDPGGPVIRDFGLAIQEVAEKIKLRNHLPGSAILVVKRGAGANTFDKLTFEQEVIASLKEDSSIKVFTIETQQGLPMPYTNLQSLTEATSGNYHLINDTMNIAKKLEGFLSSLHELLDQGSIMNSVSSWTTQKQYTEPNQAIEIPIHDDVSTVRVHLTTSRQLRSSQIRLKDLSGEQETPEPIEKGEWDENSDLSRRSVFTYLIRNPKQGSVWSIEHDCPSEKDSECRFFLLVTADTDRPTPRELAAFTSKSIDIDVSTSAEHNYLDMSQQGFRMVPFAIYAKIEMNQQRVLGLENVTALVRLGGDHSISWSIPLADDGLGLPDVADHDGIYSGVFTPLEDGLYQISVAASGVSGSGRFQDIRIVNKPGALIPLDQINFGCKNSSKLRCLSAVPLGSFSRVQDMRETVAVENTATFKAGKPMKILDFSVTTEPGHKVTFRFTSPKLLGSDESPEEFGIFMAPHPDNFLGSTDMTKRILAVIGSPSGERVSLTYDAVQKAIPYYAVEAVYKGQSSGPSNVVGVVISEDGQLPFPTTTTTTSIPTTPEATPEPTTTEEIIPETTTTEYPWPSTTSTTGIPLPSTTEESEDPEPDEPIEEYVHGTEESEPPESSTEAIGSTSADTERPTTTENVVFSSTSTDFIVTAPSTTTEPPSTGGDSEMSGASFDIVFLSTEFPTTTEESERSSSSWNVISTTTMTGEEPPSTTENSGSGGMLTEIIFSSTTVPSITTGESEDTSSSTEMISSTQPSMYAPTTLDDVESTTTGELDTMHISSDTPLSTSSTTTENSELSHTSTDSISSSTTEHEVVEGESEDEIATDVSPPMASTSTEGMESTTSEDMKSTTTEDLGSTTTEGLESTTTEDMKSTTTEGMESTTTEGMESTTTEGMGSTTTEGLESTTTEDLESTTTEDMKSTKNEGMESTTEDMKSTTTEDMKSTTTEDMKSTTTEDMKSTTTEDLESTTTEDMKSTKNEGMESTTEDMKSTTTEDMKSTTNEDMNSTTTEDVESTTTEDISPVPATENSDLASALTTNALFSTSPTTENPTTTEEFGILSPSTDGILHSTTPSSMEEVPSTTFESISNLVAMALTAESQITTDNPEATATPTDSISMSIPTTEPSTSTTTEESELTSTFFARSLAIPPTESSEEADISSPSTYLASSTPETGTGDPEVTSSPSSTPDSPIIAELSEGLHISPELILTMSSTTETPVTIEDVGVTGTSMTEKSTSTEEPTTTEENDTVGMLADLPSPTSPTTEIPIDDDEGTTSISSSTTAESPITTEESEITSTSTDSTSTPSSSEPDEMVEIQPSSEPTTNGYSGVTDTSTDAPSSTPPPIEFVSSTENSELPSTSTDSISSTMPATESPTTENVEGTSTSTEMSSTTSDPEITSISSDPLAFDVTFTTEIPSTSTVADKGTTSTTEMSSTSTESVALDISEPSDDTSSSTPESSTISSPDEDIPDNEDTPDEEDTPTADSSSTTTNLPKDSTSGNTLAESGTSESGPLSPTSEPSLPSLPTSEQVSSDGSQEPSVAEPESEDDMSASAKLGHPEVTSLVILALSSIYFHRIFIYHE